MSTDHRSFYTHLQNYLGTIELSSAAFQRHYGAPVWSVLFYDAKRVICTVECPVSEDIFSETTAKDVAERIKKYAMEKYAKPISQLNNQSLLDAMVCQGSCSEHEGYTPIVIRAELERRLVDRDALQTIYLLAIFVVDPEDRDDVPYAIDALRQEITQHQMNKRNV
jgi:hypothetical protein